MDGDSTINHVLLFDRHDFPVMRVMMDLCVDLLLEYSNAVAIASATKNKGCLEAYDVAIINRSSTQLESAKRVQVEILDSVEEIPVYYFFPFYVLQLIGIGPHKSILKSKVSLSLYSIFVSDSLLSWICRAVSFHTIGVPGIGKSGVVGEFLKYFANGAIWWCDWLWLSLFRIVLFFFAEAEIVEMESILTFAPGLLFVQELLKNPLVA
ncbi:hypothetical protein Tco_1532881 [Tanacetum coccineum]